MMIAAQSSPHTDTHLDPLAVDKTLFGPSGRFNMYRWHKLLDETKNEVFTPEGLQYLKHTGLSLCNHLSGSAKEKCEKAMGELLPRYCRCISQVTAEDLYRHADRPHNAYGVCQASLSRARYGSGIQPSDIRSLLAVTSRRADCSTTLDIDKIPTSFLYAYAVQHLETTKGNRVFGGKVPNLDLFLKNREYWRPLLTSLIKKYIASGRDLPHPTVHGRYELLQNPL